MHSNYLCSSTMTTKFMYKNANERTYTFNTHTLTHREHTNITKPFDRIHILHLLLVIYCLFSCFTLCAVSLSLYVSSSLHFMRFILWFILSLVFNIRLNVATVYRCCVCRIKIILGVSFC